MRRHCSCVVSWGRSGIRRRVGGAVATSGRLRRWWTSYSRAWRRSIDHRARRSASLVGVLAVSTRDCWPSGCRRPSGSSSRSAPRFGRLPWTTPTLAGCLKRSVWPSETKRTRLTTPLATEALYPCRPRRSSPSLTASCRGGRASMNGTRDTKTSRCSAATAGSAITPGALTVIADRLSQPSDAWKHYEPSGAARQLTRTWSTLPQ
jgi:hypothetical protein